VLQKHIEHAIGSVERPMTKEALEKKFSDQAATALPQDQIDNVMALCWDIEALEDVSIIAKASVPKT
jgi:2-methylcitrate dehydratase PrpD